MGDKTFVLQAGAWLDTQFDTATMQAEAVVFGSERYFQLLSQHPEIGRYLALGERVTLVLDGKPYTMGRMDNRTPCRRLRLQASPDQGRRRQRPARR